MKIVICTPHFREVHAKFVISLMSLVAHTYRAEIVFNGQPTTPDIQVFMNNGSVLSDLRNTLVRMANEWGANYLLWLDADHTFPPDVLMRLLSHNLPVVGANYPRRTSPTFPTAQALDGDHLWTTLEAAEAGHVERVARLGLGVCLVDMTILGALERAAQRAGQETLWPLFAQEAIPDALEVKGEDTYFFELLTRGGIPAYVDHGVSWDVGHVHEVILTNADAEQQREAYLKKRAGA